MVRKVPAIVALLIAAPFVVVMGYALLVVLQVSAPIFNSVNVAGPGGVGKDVIQFNGAWVLLATVGILSIPGSVALYLLIGGRGSAERQVPRGRL